MPIPIPLFAPPPLGLGAAGAAIVESVHSHGQIVSHPFTARARALCLSLSLLTLSFSLSFSLGLTRQGVVLTYLLSFVIGSQ